LISTLSNLNLMPILIVGLSTLSNLLSIVKLSQGWRRDTLEKLTRSLSLMPYLSTKGKNVSWLLLPSFNLDLLIYIGLDPRSTLLRTVCISFSKQ
jgi:hypothetical protein